MFLKYFILAIFKLSLFLSFSSFADVNVKVENTSDECIKYLEDNFKYDDEQRKWHVLPPHSVATLRMEHSTKHGYLMLKIKRSFREELLYSYIPTGKNPNVTIVVEKDEIENRLRAGRYRFRR